jgi:uncharacterized phiE125 gp8 family phage protein
MGLALITAPTDEPITLDEAKEHCRVDVDDDDNYITSLIAAARRITESMTDRALITQTWRLKLDRFPCDCIYVPRPPLASVSSITYVDTQGATQTWSSTEYRVDTDSYVGRITPAYGYTWPVLLPVINAVTITFVAGYGNADAVPQDLKQAMLMLIGHMYENREPVTFGQPSLLPLGYNTLVGPYCVVTF